MPLRMLKPSRHANAHRYGLTDLETATFYGQTDADCPALSHTVSHALPHNGSPSRLVPPA
jgi:hypothetical protein